MGLSAVLFLWALLTLEDKVSYSFFLLLFLTVSAASRFCFPPLFKFEPPPLSACFTHENKPVPGPTSLSRTPKMRPKALQPLASWLPSKSANYNLAEIRGLALAVAQPSRPTARATTVKRPAQPTASVQRRLTATPWWRCLQMWPWYFSRRWSANRFCWMPF